MFVLVSFDAQGEDPAEIIAMIQRMTETVASDVDVREYEPLSSCVECPSCGDEVDTRTARSL